MRTIHEVLPPDAAARLGSYKLAVEHAVPGVAKGNLVRVKSPRTGSQGSDHDVAVVIRDLSDRRRVHRTLSDLAYDHILNGSYIRPIPLPSGYLEARGRRPSELAEEIVRDGAEIT